MTRALLIQTIAGLIRYCEETQWAGYDPYDGLNSPIFRSIPFMNNKLCRLAFIQAMKRSPINLRPLLRIPKMENPKGLALFISALLKLRELELVANQDTTITYLLKRLVDLRSVGQPYYCWGYHFDWQSRAFFLPRYAPNIICTSFAGNSLLDAYVQLGDERLLLKAVSAGKFILEGLNISEDVDGICFSYTQYDRGHVHNANLLGMAFLSRLYGFTGETKFLKYAISAARFTVAKQREGGFWYYGEGASQRWVDNFHTGYNLLALKRIGEYCETDEFLEALRIGLDFYIKHFITYDGRAKYFHNRLFPIDIHSIAQSIVTMTELSSEYSRGTELAQDLAAWSLRNMYSRKGFFCYQKTRWYTIGIPYIRWSQAWMLYSLATLAKDLVTRGIL